MNSDVTKKVLPATITSYDLIKAFAVIVMIVDHIGYYFFPDTEWFRAVGRIQFPVWFFLAGYATGRVVSSRLVAGAVLLLVANLIVGLPLLPLNALFTFIAIRISIDVLMKPVVEQRERLWPVALLLFLLIVPSWFLTEYGTMAFIAAMFGYMVKRRKDLFSNSQIKLMMGFTVVSYVLITQLTFAFDTAQSLLVMVGTTLVCLFLGCFNGGEAYPRLERWLPGVVKWSLTFMGRHTLEIYVVHLIVFKLACILATSDERFSWFRLEWL